MTPNPARLVEEFHAFEASAALRTAIELDLFTKIAAGRNTPGVLASDCRADKHGIQVLCDYLTARGHLWKQGSRYRLTLNSRLYLARSSPAYLGSAAEFFAADVTLAAFSRLRQAVKRGRCADKDALGAKETYWVRFASTMAPLAQPVAEFAAAALAAESDGPIRVLDLAAGHGLYGCEIALRNRRAQVFALDFPRVLKVAIQNARRKGLKDRYHLLPGDLFKVGFGGPYDMVLAANLAHHLDQRSNHRLFEKCRQALNIGGRLVVIDSIPDAAFALHLLATSGDGRIYSLREYSRMLRSAGFGRIRPVTSGPRGSWMITASN
jgi:SAM-dependent methyltransferase